jgi:hypothetical protein
LETIQGYKLDFWKNPHQTKIPSPSFFSREESAMISEEVLSMYQKVAIVTVEPDSSSFLSNLFIVPKKDGGSRPVINLRVLNFHLPYEHFKMEGIHLLRDILFQGDWQN